MRICWVDNARIVSQTSLFDHVWGGGGNQTQFLHSGVNDCRKTYT